MAKIGDLKKNKQPLLMQKNLTSVEGAVMVGDSAVVLTSGTMGAYCAKSAPWRWGNTLSNGVAIEGIDGVNRIFGGLGVLVALAGKTLHFLKYKGKGSFIPKFELTTANDDVDMEVCDIAISVGGIAILEKLHGMSFQVRLIHMDSIMACKDSKEAQMLYGTATVAPSAWMEHSFGSIKWLFCF